MLKLLVYPFQGMTDANKLLGGEISKTKGTANANCSQRQGCFFLFVNAAVFG